MRSATPPVRTARRSSPRRRRPRSAEAARLTATAHAQIEAERQTALVSLRSEVGTLALDLAGGVIGESLSDDKKAQAVVDRFLAELEASEKRRRDRDRGRNGQRDHSGARRDDGGARRRVGRRPRRRPRAVRRGARRRRLVAPERRARRLRRARRGARARSSRTSSARRSQPTTVSLLTTVVAQRWSSARPTSSTRIEELAVRAAAVADARRRRRGRAVRGSRGPSPTNPELELALGSRLGDAAAKGALVETLLDGRASAATALIVSSLVQQPRERRVRQLLSRAMRLVADQRGRTVATVVAAAPLSAAQAERLTRGARASATAPRCRSTRSSTRSVVGGLRVQIADDVIDAQRLGPPRGPPPAARRLTQTSRPRAETGASPHRRPHTTKGRQWQNSRSAPTSSVTR